MGKKSKQSGGNGDKKAKAASTEMLLRVAMHCKCNGCRDKIRSGINDLAILSGVEALDKTAVESKGEVRLVATAEPEKLRQRLHKATGKKVDLVVIVPQAKAKPADDKDDVAAAAAVAAALRQQAQAQAQAAVHLAPAGAWAGNGGWNAAAVAYPPDAAGYYYSPSYPAGGWGPYAAAFPPPGQQLGHGAYGGGGGAVSPWYTRG
ncbi:heavy metal-associated isoprenylated plant protein 3-like [Oryza brachyantha]|uniref:heavy metal-associated isoprenylated plant protein 3-like n=1 Tax=Oryza brachyantha TaxID=4533 RepID=UPI001ADCD0F7|nr:heavy metal-associated isoprenylated plant protein 3-like [Oryza brachyantha]